MKPPRALVVGMVLFLAMSCADFEQLAMCQSYAEFETTYDRVASADPTGATAAEAAEVVEGATGQLRQLRSTADERYSAQIDELESSLDDLERTLRSVNDEASYSIWEPLVDETLEDVVRANARLRRAIGPACQDRTQEVSAPMFNSSQEK